MKDANAVENITTETHFFFGKEKNFVVVTTVLMKKYVLISSSNPSYKEKLLEEYEWLLPRMTVGNIISIYHYIMIIFLNFSK